MLLLMYFTFYFFSIFCLFYYYFITGVDFREKNMNSLDANQTSERSKPQHNYDVASALGSEIQGRFEGGNLLALFLKTEKKS